MNSPQTGGEPIWPTEPLWLDAASDRDGTGDGAIARSRSVRGRAARWAIGLSGAAALAAACVLGVSVASGSSSPHATRAALTSAGARAAAGGPASGNTGGAAAAAGSSGFAVTSSAGQAGAHVGGPALHACVGSARHLRAAGHLAAARAKLRACLRRYAGATRARFARLALLARHAMHGQITVATKNGPKTIVFERGTIQSVSGTSIVVKAADGVTWTWQIGSETRIFRAGSGAGGSGHSVGKHALAVGQRVAAGGLLSGGTDQARRILIRDSSPA